MTHIDNRSRNFDNDLRHLWHVKHVTSISSVISIIIAIVSAIVSTVVSISIAIIASVVSMITVVVVHDSSHVVHRRSHGHHVKATRMIEWWSIVLVILIFGSWLAFLSLRSRTSCWNVGFDGHLMRTWKRISRHHVSRIKGNWRRIHRLVWSTSVHGISIRLRRRFIRHVNMTAAMRRLLCRKNDDGTRTFLAFTSSCVKNDRRCRSTWTSDNDYVVLLGFHGIDIIQEDEETCQDAQHEPLHHTGLTSMLSWQKKPVVFELLFQVIQTTGDVVMIRCLWSLTDLCRKTWQNISFLCNEYL